MKKVIVTDGLSRKSLSVVRSLGKSKYNICVTGNSIFTTSFWSKYTKQRIILPSIKKKFLFTKKFISFLKNNFNKEKYILFPMEDETINWLSNNRNKLSKYTSFLIPTKKSLMIAQHKSLTYKFAQKNNFPIPLTIITNSFKNFLKEIKQIKTKSDYIVKPSVSNGSHGIVYLKTKNFSNLDWKKHWNKFGKLIIQKCVPNHGSAIGVSVLFDKKNNCIASFAHRRLQQYPNSGGPSTSRVSILNYKLIRKSIKVLKKLNWCGVAMVEWKIDPTNKKPMLLEINPRFWGSLELAVRSGVDFPLLYARASTNQKQKVHTCYKKKIICRWIFPGEIIRYITQNKKKRESLKSFFKNFLSTAEEWDKNDYPGFISSFFCNFILIFNYKFWKYLKR